MMKKIILIALTACGITCTTLSLADLVLANNTNNDISVNCNGLGGIPVAAHKNADFAWYILSSMFGNSFKCVFSGGSMTGVAYVDVSNDMSTGALYNVSASGVNLDYNGYSPAPENFASNITVSINP